ncbi:MAG: hypothetical protein R2856_08080 [Caldilineaceae bacterium]
MRYYASMMVDLIEGAPADTGHRPLLLPCNAGWNRSSRQSVLRVPKGRRLLCGREECTMNEERRMGTLR